MNQIRLVQLSITVIVIVSSLPTVQGGVCAAGWYKNFDYCYFVSGVHNSTTWSEASRQCDILYSDLVFIENKAENDYVYSLSVGVTTKNIWIGYFQVFGTIWRWEGSSSSQWTYWDTEEPDDDGKCARMSVNLGSWRDRDCSNKLDFVCKRLQDCPVPPVVPFASGTMNATTAPTSRVGTVVTYTCDYGYEYPDESSVKSITCEVGGVWSSVPNCIRKVCPIIPSFKHVIFNDTNNDVDNVISYECAPNHWFSYYEANVTKVARCDSTIKKWTQNFSECEEVSCIRPITSHATASSPLNVFGTRVTYDCDLGYIYPDNTTTKEFFCQLNGGWLPPPMPCEIQQCKKINVTNAVPSTTARYFDTTVTWTCIGGHEYSDSSILKHTYCNPEGKWEPATLPACYPISCGAAPNVTNAVKDTNDTIYATVVNYTCYEGHFFIDGSTWRTVECDEFGDWSGNPTPCLSYKIEIKLPPERAPIEAEGSDTIGAIAIVLIVLLVAGLVLFDVFTFKMHWDRMKKNLPCIKRGEDVEKNPEKKSKETDHDNAEKQTNKFDKNKNCASAPTAGESRPASRASTAWVENEKNEGQNYDGTPRFDDEVKLDNNNEVTDDQPRDNRITNENIDTNVPGDSEGLKGSDNSREKEEQETTDTHL